MDEITNDFTVTTIDLLKAAESTADPVEQLTKASQSVLKEEILYIIGKKYSSLLAHEVIRVFLDVSEVLAVEEKQIYKNLKNLNMEDKNNG